MRCPPVKASRARLGICPSINRSASAGRNGRAIESPGARGHGCRWVRTDYSRSQFSISLRAGIINVHASLLPKYRGAAPIQWAIVRGESHTGVTTMKINAGLDTGDMLLKWETPIGDRRLPWNWARAWPSRAPIC